MRGQITGVLGASMLAAGIAIANTNAPVREPSPRLTFAKDERIVFLGDSITEKGQEPDGFVTLIQEAVERQRPELSLKIHGAGAGWEKLAHMRDRIGRTVAIHNPAKVVVQGGLNDLDLTYSANPASQKIFAMCLKDIIWRLRGADAEPILTTLTLVGERPRGQNEYDALTDTYSQIIREVAAEKRCRVIDLRELLVAYEDAHNTNRVAEGFLTTGGGVHLSPLGNRVVANMILEDFGFAPIPTEVGLASGAATPAGGGGP